MLPTRASYFGACLHSTLAEALHEVSAGSTHQLHVNIKQDLDAPRGDRPAQLFPERWVQVQGCIWSPACSVGKVEGRPMLQQSAKVCSWLASKQCCGLMAL